MNNLTYQKFFPLINHGFLPPHPLPFPLVFRVTFPVSFLNTWSTVHTFHTRQNHGHKKEPEINFIFPFLPSLRKVLLTNRNFPVKLSWIHHCHRQQLQWAYVPAEMPYVRVSTPPTQIRHARTKCLLKRLFGLNVGVYIFKILPASLRVKTYLFVFQLFYISGVSLLYITEILLVIF